MRWLVFLALILIASQDPQFPTIGVIDFYGLGPIPEREAREFLQIKEGDSISNDLEEAKRRLELLPGVEEARIDRVCCVEGKAILYVGVRRKGESSIEYRADPQSKVRLPPEVIQAGKDYQKALQEAVLKGDPGEDNSRGHALSDDPATRAVQERFIRFAAQDLKLLRDALRNSADAEHRALAAQIIAYADNKQEIVNDLVEAMRDPVEEVRNNAMRALWVMPESTRGTTEQPIRIPGRPFIEMLNSIEWRDRNKSSMALLKITSAPSPSILSELRRKAIPALVEMAKWKTPGHAKAPFILLGRVAGIPEEEINAAWERGDHASFIEAATKKAKSK
ncbi:MAG TPA: HEAT repeat domain-containing protein [Blastocatellia bacterium]